MLYANNSRGKIESVILGACTQIAIDLSRVAQDLINFSLPEFGYFVLPKEFCTGSSIMPQKRNPCGMELVRAEDEHDPGLLQPDPQYPQGLAVGLQPRLPGDQAPLLPGRGLTIACVRVMDVTFQKLEVCDERLVAAFQAAPEVFATDEALRLVVEGVPFRDAYRQVAASLDNLRPPIPGRASPSGSTSAARPTCGSTSRTRPSATSRSSPKAARPTRGERSTRCSAGPRLDECLTILQLYMGTS